MKIYLVGDYDSVLIVTTTEKRAIEDFTNILANDNGAWVTVWENDEQIYNDSIYDKLPKG